MTLASIVETQQSSPPSPTTPPPKRFPLVRGNATRCLGGGGGGGGGDASKLVKSSGIDTDVRTTYYCSNHVLVNRERSKRCLRPYQRSKYLDNLARFHARQMAKECRLRSSYQKIYELQVKLRSDQVSENVQKGICIRSMHAVCMNQDCSNRRNLLAGEYDQFGMGTAIGADGYLYMAQLFRVKE